MLKFSDNAKKIMARLDKPARKLIGGELRKFQNGEPIDLKKLKTEKKKWRIAAGTWRIILETEKSDEGTLFVVTDVVPRKDAY